MPDSTSARKIAIRKNAKIKATTEAIGQHVLTDLRDALFKVLIKLPNNKLKEYIINSWMDAEAVQPPYIKVTGNGKKAPYTAKVMDPLDNEKLKHLNKGKIKLEKNGISAILVIADGHKIMKMRAKWESQPLASSMKFSGDPG